jgi:hypothetical protein
MVTLTSRMMQITKILYMDISLSYGIDVDSKGNVLVNDIGHNQINLFDSTGKLISTLGSSGDSPGQFNHPHSNEIDDEKRRVNNTSNLEPCIWFTIY